MGDAGRGLDGAISALAARSPVPVGVEVTDDGAGGADPAQGSGLRGLADRAAAIDGRLTVTSPPGGPTVVRAELPCGR